MPRSVKRRACVGVAGLMAVTLAPDLAAAQASFTDQTAAAGVTFSNSPAPDAPLKAMWGGLTAGDFNNDGYPDLFAASGGGVPDRLFINNGNGTFTDRAAAWGLTALDRINGATVGDYDNDGDFDLYLVGAGYVGAPVSTGGNRLYRNNLAQGSATFTEVGAAAGVNVTATTVSQVFPTSATFGDYDLDGDLDLFACSWRPGNATGTDGNRLFRNNGDGTFTDVTVAAGVFDSSLAGFAPRLIDLNGDRYPELIVTGDWGTSRFFRNNGDGTFTDATLSAKLGLDRNGMGSTVGDFNQDGRIDWYVTAIQTGLGNFVYVNQGGDLFISLPKASGAKNGGWGWAAAAVDFDHDGDVDLIETNGWYTPKWQNIPTYLFRNNGNLTFAEIHAASGLVNLHEGRSLITLDYDRDGDLDVAMSTNNNMSGGPIFLYRSELSGSTANWLQVALDPAGHAGLAPMGLGSRVRVTAGGRQQFFSMSGGDNYLGQSELVAHFGLGAATQAAEVVVEWANGATTVLTGVAANQRVTVTPPALFTRNLSVGDATVIEGNSGTLDAVFTVRLSAADAADVAVPYQTIDGTARAGGDYVATVGSLIIPAGSTTAAVAVPVVGEIAIEPDETFILRLGSVAGTFLLDADGVGTILDTDGKLLWDDFGDGVMDWTVGSGTWTESGGMLSATASGTSAATAPVPWQPSGTGSCKTCTTEATVVPGAGSTVSLAGWHQDWSNHFRLTGNESADTWTLEEVRSGSIVKKKSLIQKIYPNVPYEVRMFYTGSLVRGYIDGMHLLSLSPSQPLNGGNVGLRSIGAASFEQAKAQ